jgi:hypothetical protein
MDALELLARQRHLRLTLHRSTIARGCDIHRPITRQTPNCAGSACNCARSRPNSAR